MKLNINSLLFKAMKSIIVGLFSLILLYLTILSCFSTTAITDAEHSLLIADSPFLNLAIAGFFLSAIIIGKKAINKWIFHGILDKFADKDYFVKVLYLLLGIIALIFVLLVQKGPKSDQYSICRTASEWAHNDFSSLDPGGYLFVYPHQAGIVLFLYMLRGIFGRFNYIAFRFVNILSLLQIVKSFSYFTRTYNKRSFGCESGVILFSILFLPCVMYTTFIYGTLLGLALALSSFKNVLSYQEEKKVRQAVTGIICIFLAIALKKNYLIFAIALIFYIVYIQVKEKFSPLLSLLMLAIIVTVGVNSSVINYNVFLITHKQLGKGMTNMAYISMGISEGSPLYDGWWEKNNRPSKSFKKFNYNIELHKEACIEHIQERLTQFIKSPGYALHFFAGKNASQWNNPDFQGWWINETMPNKGKGILPIWLERFSSVFVYYSTIFVLLNYVQFIILFGVIMYLMLEKGKKDAYILLMITFIGGFLFQSIWEAKGQYTFVYFTLLLPISVEGYVHIIHLIESLARYDRKQVLQLSLKFVWLPVILFVVGTDAIPIFGEVFVRQEDTTKFHQYISENAFHVIPNGAYKLHPAVAPETNLAVKGNPGHHSSKALFCTNSEEYASRLKIQMAGAYTMKISFPKTDMYLGVCEKKKSSRRKVKAYKQEKSEKQTWKMLYLKDTSSYALRYDTNLALTYDADKNKIFLAEYDGSINQQWLLEKLQAEG